MDPEQKALIDALETAQNHFDYALTNIDIDIAICELNIAEIRLNAYLNKRWHVNQ